MSDHAHVSLPLRLRCAISLPRRSRWPRPAAHAERMKDLASIQGVRDNQLVGYGLVVGLDGTGDQTTQTPFTTQSLTQHAAAARHQRCRPAPNMQLKNVAAVMVTAQLPAFAQPGPDDRRHGVVARQRQEPARRHAADDAAEGRRRPDLRAWRRATCVVGGAGASANGSKVQINHLERRPHLRRARRRARGADAARRRATPCSWSCNETDLRHGAAQRGARDQRTFGPGTAHALDGRVIQRARAGRSPDAARRLPGATREPRRAPGASRPPR